MVSSPKISVSVGIILKGDQVLIAQRPLGKPLPGLWEFPGGKIEQGESSLDALKRELQEEVGITVLEAELWNTVEHDYNNYSVVLFNWIVKQFTGSPKGMEKQDIRWACISTLDQYQFPEANRDALKHLKSLGAVYNSTMTAITR